MDFKPCFRMMVCSDVHYGESEAHPEKYVGAVTEKERFENAVKFAYGYGHLDAFVAVGDFVTSGKESEMLDFKKSLDKVIRKDTEIILTMASHEYFYDGVENATERFVRIFGQKPVCHKKVCGFSLIGASTDDRCQTGAEKQLMIKTELKKAAEDDPKKPIFFFFHPQFQNTVYGSAVLWRTSAIPRAVMNYPQVVAFGGHSHAPINDPRNVHQRHFTCFGTGAIVGLSCCNADRQPFHKAVDCSHFLIVEADSQNRVRTLAIDAVTGKVMREWIVENPHEPDSFIYTDARYLTAKEPTFEKGAEIFASYENGMLTVSAPQAKDGNERVPGYLFTVRDRDGFVKARFEISSGYQHYILPERAQFSTPFEAKSGKYTVECRAVSFYDMYSQKLITEFNI